MGYWAIVKVIVIIVFCNSDPIPHSAADSDAWALAADGDDDSVNHCNSGAKYDHWAIANYTSEARDQRECSTYCPEGDNKACADGSCDECISNFKHSYLEPVDVVYMVSVSLTSVGYGDFSPTTQSARGFTVIWLMIGTLLVGNAFGSAADHFLQNRQQKLNKKNMQQTFDHSKIMKMDDDGSGEVNEIEFIATMLVKGNVVKQIELDDLQARFKELDKSGDGFIGEEDLVDQDEDLKGGPTDIVTEA